MEADLSFSESRVCCLGRVLVLLDLRNGLASDIDIKHGDTIFIQTLDYVAIPFKCNRCHSYGHLVSHCHLSLKNNYHDELKPKFVWRVKKPMFSTDFDEVRNDSVRPRVEGMDISCEENVTSCIPTLKPLSIPY